MTEGQETGAGRLTGWHWYYDDARQGTEATRAEAEDALERAIGERLADLVERDHPNEGTYYYRTEEEADADLDGAYAWSVVRESE